MWVTSKWSMLHEAVKARCISCVDAHRAAPMWNMLWVFRGGLPPKRRHAQICLKPREGLLKGAKGHQALVARGVTPLAPLAPLPQLPLSPAWPSAGPPGAIEPWWRQPTCRTMNGISRTSSGTIMTRTTLGTPLFGLDPEPASSGLPASSGVVIIMVLPAAVTFQCTTSPEEMLAPSRSTITDIGRFSYPTARDSLSSTIGRGEMAAGLKRGMASTDPRTRRISRTIAMP